jgi:hypothetical protein
VLTGVFGSGDVTVRYFSGAAVVAVGTQGPVVSAAGSPLGINTGPLLAFSVVTDGATITHAVWRSSTSIDVLRLDAADLLLASPVTQTGQRINMADAVLPKVTVRARSALPATSTPVRALTFAVADTAMAGSAASGSIVNTGNQAQAWSITPPAGVTVTPSSGTLAAGATQALSVTAASAGTYSLTLVAAGATITGSPQSLVVSAIPALPSGTPAPFTLTAPTTGTHPFVLGYPLRQGDVPAGSGIVITGANAQADIKTTWPDGSAKFAVIAGTASLTANTPLSVSLAAGSAAAGTALTTADLIATGITAEVTAGAFGSASFGNTEWAAPFQAWVSGPRMSSWVYRKPVGSDTHLVAWMEVRLFAGGAVEVLPWVENGYILRAGHTNKLATYTFTLGGTERFSRSIDLKHRQRTVLISGTILSHWLGSDPGVQPSHDRAYLQATELVPSYRAVVSDGYVASRFAAATFEPLQQGDYRWGQGNTGGNGNDNMADTGYSQGIGVLPGWDVCYLANSTSPLAYPIVIRNAYSAGRYSIHYRDENTNRPLKFSQWAPLAINDGQGVVNNGSGNQYASPGTGGNGPSWDLAHSPSVGFMAYLLTGRFYFMEEVQFAATLNGLAVMRQVRTNNDGAGYVGSFLFKPAIQVVQTRATAWGIRTLAQALCITPTTDPVYPDLLKQMEDNCRYYHNTYVVQPNNPFGLIQPGEDVYGPGNNSRMVSVFQQDFVTAAWGYARSMGLPLSTAGQTRLAEFFAWKAKGTIFRLGAASDFWYVNANPYTVTVSSAAYPNFEAGTGPWLATPAEVYAATYPSGPPAAPNGSTTEGVLGLDFGTTIAAAQGYWGSTQAAISYAVRHGVTGAVAAFNRMVNATNYAEIAGYWNTNFPVMGTKPLTGLVSLPAWVSSATVNQLAQFPAPGSEAPWYLKDFSGLAQRGLQDATGEVTLYTVLAGGHSGNLFFNETKKFQLDADSPVWELLRPNGDRGAWDITGQSGPYFPNGEPAPRHTYVDVLYVPEHDRVVAGGRFWGSGSGDYNVWDGFRLSDNEYDPAGTYPNRPGFTVYVECVDPSTGIWYGTAGLKWTPGASPAASAFSAFNLTGSATTGLMGTAFDTRRRRLYHLSVGNNFSDAPRVINSCTIDIATGVKTAIGFNPSPAWTQFQADAAAGHFLGSKVTYYRTGDRFYFYNGGGEGTTKFYEIVPNATTTWDMNLLAVTGGTPGRSISDTRGGVLTKFMCVDRWGMLILVVPYERVWYLKVA